MSTAHDFIDPVSLLPRCHPSRIVHLLTKWRLHDQTYDDLDHRLLALEITVTRPESFFAELTPSYINENSDQFNGVWEDEWSENNIGTGEIYPGDVEHFCDLLKGDGDYAGWEFRLFVLYNFDVEFPPSFDRWRGYAVALIACRMMNQRHVLTLANIFCIDLSP